jgi:hypothetical protein
MQFDFGVAATVFAQARPTSPAAPAAVTHNTHDLRRQASL